MDLDTSATGSCSDGSGENSPLDLVSLTPELLPGDKPSKSSSAMSSGNNSGYKGVLYHITQ